MSCSASRSFSAISFEKPYSVPNRMVTTKLFGVSGGPVAPLGCRWQGTCTHDPPSPGRPRGVALFSIMLDSRCHWTLECSGSASRRCACLFLFQIAQTLRCLLPAHISGKNQSPSPPVRLHEVLADMNSVVPWSSTARCTTEGLPGRSCCTTSREMAAILTCATGGNTGRLFQKSTERRGRLLLFPASEQRGVRDIDERHTDRRCQGNLFPCELCMRQPCAAAAAVACHAFWPSEADQSSLQSILVRLRSHAGASFPLIA